MKNALYALIGLLIGAAGMFGYGFYRNHMAQPEAAASAPAVAEASEAAAPPSAQTTAGNRPIPAAFQGVWMGNQLQSTWQDKSDPSYAASYYSTPAGAQAYCNNSENTGIGASTDYSVDPLDSGEDAWLTITPNGIEKSMLETSVNIRNLHYTVYTPNHIAGTAEYVIYDFSCRKEVEGSFDTTCENKHDSFELRLEGDTLYITNGYDYIDDTTGKRMIGTNTGRFVRHPCPPKPDQNT
ncbi:hypothetical protein [Eikenella corrodens]|uniref:Uncharacterized protein n=1 Tax=Eikenella corrodens TaxID=539 RepID=A0A3S9SKF0_EIKCO|nr:hypothetical protein [Eikenella corrodens]AZR59997.1 hypothetical protein ELB75_08145 [Eikenella corrodens]